MADENFFSRWSRRKAETGKEQPLPQKPAAAAAAAPATEADPAAAPQPATAQPAAGQAQPRLTLEDVAQLTPDSDFSPFMARGVDQHVRRSAMKKLFSNPHFNVMDGLDIYIDDYSKSVPIPPEMLAALNHAKFLLDPLSRLDKPFMPLSDSSAESGQTPGNKDSQEADEAIAADPEPGPMAASDAAPAADSEPAPEQPQANAADQPPADPTQHSQVRS